ncbi:phosphodiester glycosidase family protein [Brevibacillus ginsengisoli]|uniref:phosphodiester glycosidase family protein n=1 Tax=Brevibacillus ginsengisoli TaxID=363854 RepID=UPI003CE740F2
MKGKWMPMLVCLLLCVCYTPVSAMGSKTETIQMKTGKKVVSYVYFHPSENVELKPVFAQGKVGMAEELNSMAKHNEAIAAINGTFFNAYDHQDLQPQGGIASNQQLLHWRGGPTLLGILNNNELFFGSADSVRIAGSRNDSWEWPQAWYAWFVNHLPTSQNEIVVFTPQFRTNQLQLPGFSFVNVAQGKVATITKDQTQIPSNGFVIAYGSAQAKTAASFQVGDRVAYRVDLPEPFKTWKYLISVGPKLLTGGKVDVNFQRDGIRDPKLLTQSAQRSFIGYKNDKTIVMGTVANVTIPQLAELTQKLGLQEAMNLDGGASSGLYYNGKYLTKPGRKLSNCLVVVKKPASKPAPPDSK